jgi:hypothetical protein
MDARRPIGALRGLVDPGDVVGKRFVDPFAFGGLVALVLVVVGSGDLK